MPELARQGPAVTEIDVLQKLLGCAQRIEATLHDIYVRLGWGSPAVRAGAPPLPAPTGGQIAPAPPTARYRAKGSKPAFTGVQIRALRQRMGLSVIEFGPRIGMSPAMLYQVEASRCGFPLKYEAAVRDLMAKHLGAS